MSKLNEAIEKYIKEVHILQTQVDHGTRNLSEADLAKVKAKLQLRKRALARFRKVQAARIAAPKKPCTCVDKSSEEKALLKQNFILFLPFSLSRQF